MIRAIYTVHIYREVQSLAFCSYHTNELDLDRYPGIEDCRGCDLYTTAGRIVCSFREMCDIPVSCNPESDEKEERECTGSNFL